MNIRQYLDSTYLKTAVQAGPSEDAIQLLLGMYSRGY
jgi:hypothetical protein